MKQNLNVETFSRVKSLLNYLEDHESLNYNQCQIIIEGVNQIWERLDRRRGAARHPEDKS